MTAIQVMVKASRSEQNCKTLFWTRNVTGTFAGNPAKRMIFMGWQAYFPV